MITAEFVEVLEAVSDVRQYCVYSMQNTPYERDPLKASKRFHLSKIMIWSPFRK